MKKQLLRGSAIVAILPVCLSACGSDRDSGVPVTPPVTVTPAPTGAFQSMFGTAFAAAFNTASTGTPIDPTATSVPAINPTAAPLDN